MNWFLSCADTQFAYFPFTSELWPKYKSVWPCYCKAAPAPAWNNLLILDFKLFLQTELFVLFFYFLIALTGFSIFTFSLWWAAQEVAIPLSFSVATQIYWGWWKTCNFTSLFHITTRLQSSGMTNYHIQISSYKLKFST